MPIFEYQCRNCKNKVEKITLKPVKDTTVPRELIEPCKGKCAGAKTRHIRLVSAPAYVGTTPPATSKKATRMQELRPARDKKWKDRVKKGLNPDGRPLTNLRRKNRKEWEGTVNKAFPDLVEKQKEVVGRVKKGEFKQGLKDALPKL